MVQPLYDLKDKTMKILTKFYAIITVLFWFCAVVLLTFLTIQSLIQREIGLLFVALVSAALGFIFRKHLGGILLCLFSIGLLIILVALQPIFIVVVLCLFVGTLSFWKMIEQSIEEKFLTYTNTIHVKPSSQQHGKVMKQKWINRQNDIQQTYEWEDMNITSWFGDSTLHLGNTILPEGVNVLVMHKAYGDIRIIVPLDVGVVIYHNTLHGNVLFEQENYMLKNNRLIIYSSNYNYATKVIKIATTVYFGNLEVVHL